MSRRRYLPTGPVTHPPIPYVTGGGQGPAPAMGALEVERGAVLKPRRAAARTTIPFDLWTIIDLSQIPAPFTGVTLIGDRAPAKAKIAAVPEGYRGVVDGIFPYLEDLAASGPVTQARIPGAVTARWQVLLNGQPVPYYGALDVILAPWNGQSDRALLEFPAGSVLTCTCSLVDVGAIYDYMGIRIKGRWLPL